MNFGLINRCGTEVNTPYVQSLDPTERQAQKDVETMLSREPPREHLHINPKVEKVLSVRYDRRGSPMNRSMVGTPENYQKYEDDLRVKREK